MSNRTTRDQSTANEMGVPQGENAPRQRGKGRPFTPERAREAARKSASVRKAGAARERMVASAAPASGTQELPDGSIGVVVPIQYVDVIQALHKAAKNGDVQAARELRAWKAEHPEVNEHVRLEEQPAVLRDRLLKRLIAEEQALLDAEGGGATATTNIESAPTATAGDAAELGGGSLALRDQGASTGGLSQVPFLRNAVNW